VVRKPQRSARKGLGLDFHHNLRAAPRVRRHVKFELDGALGWRLGKVRWRPIDHHACASAAAREFGARPPKPKSAARMLLRTRERAQLRAREAIHQLALALFVIARRYLPGFEQFAQRLEVAPALVVRLFRGRLLIHGTRLPAGRHSRRRCRRRRGRGAWACRGGGRHLGPFLTARDAQERQRAGGAIRWKLQP
jgi:hypothetical protein